MTRSTALLEVRGLVVRYGDVVAVNEVSLELPRRRLTALVGRSGCGKTTLLRAIAGFEPPAAGEIVLDGETLSGEGGWVAPERRQIGMVFQEGALFPHLDVRRNVGYGLHRRAHRGRRDRRVAEVLELVGMADYGDRFPDQLSGGQQRRVALARALAPEPRLVLLDEPFAGLDAGLREHLRAEVRRILGAAGVTALLVTHDQGEALSVADRVAVMEAGRILQVGSPDEIYHRPRTPEVARFIGEGVLVPCEVEAGLVRSMLGAVEAPPGAVDGPALLFVRPEDLGVRASAEETTAHGRIVERRFFGHDVLDRVRLTGGEEIEVRVLSSEAPPDGAAVELRLRPRAFTLFPAD